MCQFINFDGLANKQVFSPAFLHKSVLSLYIKEVKFKFKIIIFIFISLLFSSSIASAKVVVLKLRTASPVYKKPSFDSKVMVNLKKGFRIYGLDTPVTLKGGFGLFYKVRLKKKIYGYIPDTAIEGFKKRGKLSLKEGKKRRFKLKDSSRNNRISKRNPVKKNF